MTGKDISTWRKSQKMKQPELAECMDVTVRTLQRIEAAEVVPEKYCEVFQKIRTRNCLLRIKDEISEILEGDQ